MYELWIANKNYSSWSLRPWVLMRELGVPFIEHLVHFGDATAWDALRRISPTGKVPCLIDQHGAGASVVWDSLAIAEYLAERHPTVWPSDPAARAWARSAAAEMHSGFGELRQRCAMSCGVRVRLYESPAPLRQDIARIGALWNDGLHRHGGPFLAGPAFTAVDAFFAPVAFRIQTYDLALDSRSGTYANRLLDLPSMREWYAAAIAETQRDEPHELEILQMGTKTLDLRAR
jgi:glutathione S-transferase